MSSKANCELEKRCFLSRLVVYRKNENEATPLCSQNTPHNKRAHKLQSTSRAPSFIDNHIYQYTAFILYLLPYTHINRDESIHYYLSPSCIGRHPLLSIVTIVGNIVIISCII